jgi:hypothetical protein
LAEDVMSVKFSVGVSETDEDRALLETLRQSPSRLESPTEEELPARRAGWPLGPDADDDSAAVQSTWAW